MKLTKLHFFVLHMHTHICVSLIATAFINIKHSAAPLFNN